jgi:predicted nucleic acid-binding Zn finger protein
MIDGVQKEGHLRYLVESDSAPGTQYLVDLLDWTCSCPDFQIRVLARKEKTECKHFPICLEMAGREFVNGIRIRMDK